MQAPGRLNFKLPQGATWIIPATWNDSTGQPIDLTGWHAAMQARTGFDASDTILDLDDGVQGGIVLGDGLGTITITVDHADTAAIAPGRYVYDLELTAGGGDVTRLLQGTLTVTPEVTRPEVTP
jgi:hypothetical protein